MHWCSALIRALSAAAALASAVALSGCYSDSITIPDKAMKTLSPDMVAELERKNMPKESPILVRIFKEEAELEVWKQDMSGHYALLKTYPICRWSGELGPKIREGDRQAPEGFYNITPALMNPNSNYYLAFNLGFPNAYDRANDRTGAFLMVHGDCSSRGCYAMTDEQIGEIFALGRESFAGGQKAFQVQAYPFRMTPLNMAKHRNSPHLAYWRMIKEGYDHFEVTRQEPKIDVCEKRYVFDAEQPPNARRPLNFSPRARCPAYQIQPEVAAAVQEKRDQDERQFAEYVARGTSTVPVRTGMDGGMHPTFLAKVEGNRSLLDGLFGRNERVAGAQPGAIPSGVMVPGARQAQMAQTDLSTSSSNAAPAPIATAGRQAAPEPQPVRVATAAPPAPAAEPAKPSMWQQVSNLMGLRGTGTAQAAPAPQPVAQPAKPRPAPKPAVAQPAKPQEQSQQQVADAHGASSSGSSLITGAVAPLPAGSFDSRFGGTR